MTSVAVQRATRSFQDAFGQAPSHVGYAPGRVNLMGDHTDYAGGFVMPVALDIGCACAVSVTDGDTHDLLAVDLDARWSSPATALEPNALEDAPGWAPYVLGVVSEWCAHHDRQIGSAMQLAVSSTVPSGSGLSSSAALEVSVASALDRVHNVRTSANDAALLCQRAEHRFAGVPCGIMDQLIACVGRAGHAIMIDCRSLEQRAVSLPSAGAGSFLLFDSRVTHRNDAGAYAARRASCERAADVMGVELLRDATPERINSHESQLDDDALRAANHVVSENKRVEQFADALERGDLATVGRLMSESHRSLSEVYRVSCTELDELQQAVVSAEGGLGARMTGGGFGGWVVALIKAGQEAAVTEAVRKQIGADRLPDDAVRSVIASDGAFVS